MTLEIKLHKMASFTKTKNGKIRARVRIAGFKPMSNTVGSMKEARYWASTTEAKIRTSKIIPELEASKHTFDELTEVYLDHIKTTKNHQFKVKKSHLNKFLYSLSGKKLSEINKSDIVIVVNEMGKEKTLRKKIRKQSTIARYLATLNHCFKFAINDVEWLSFNPISTITKPQESNPRTRFLTKEELYILLKSAKNVENRLFILIHVLVSTGMRVGEALGIRRCDYYPEENAIVLYETKNKTTRRVFIHGKAKELFDYLLDKSSKKGNNWYLFGGKDKGNYQYYRRKLLETLKTSKISDFGFHGLRHTAASYLAMSGATLQEISEILGQKSIKMANRYSHLLDSHTSEKVKELSKNIEKIGEKNE